MSKRLCLHFAAFILALLVAFGCTHSGSEPSSSGAGGRSAARGDGPKLRSWDVIDRASRWKTSVLAAEEPRIETLPGYVHVRVSVNDPRPVDCFLYDSPLITGEALVRFLSAAQIGIDYEGVEVEDVEVIANNPLILLKAAYREEAGARGKLFFGLVPRVKIPLLCSHEARTSESLHATLKQLTAGLTPSSDFANDSLAEGEQLLVGELWLFYRDGRPTGFRQWRAAKNSEGEISTLEIASFLESEGAQLAATDVRVSEREDERGLRLSDWLLLVDGELHARAALERVDSASGAKEQGASESWTYRAVGLGSEGPFESTLGSAEPLRSSYFAYNELVRAQESGETPEFGAFMPNFSTRGVTRAVYVPSPPDASAARPTGKLTVGSSAFSLTWEEGLVTSRTDLTTGLEARLFVRLFGPGGG